MRVPLFPLGVAVLLASLTASAHAEDGASLPMSASPVQASTQPSSVALDALGCMLEPSKKVSVSSPVGGVIERLPVKRGDTVRRGSVLMQLTAGVEKASVALAKAKAEFSQRKVERNQELYQEELLSPHERDEIETELVMAKMELQLRQEELALRTVKSPISGVVVERFNSDGEYVNVEPVMELATLNPLHVDVLLPAQYFGQITKGQTLSITPQMVGMTVREAQVSIVDPLIDPASGA